MGYESGREQPHRTRQQNICLEIFGQPFHFRLCFRELGIDQSDGVVLLLVDNLGIYLRGFHVRVAEQLADD